MSEEVKKLFVLLVLMLIVVPIVNAGVGISWNKETSYVPEHTKTCLTYNVYNPWPKDSSVKIKLSDELMKIVKSSSSDTVFIPKETPSSKAIPVKFCFKTPRVYTRDCLLFNKLICKQTCTQPIKTYAGEVDVMEVSSSKLASGGAGGSATAMSVSAPLKIRVRCIKHSRNYTVIYLLIALIAGILLAVDISKKRKKKVKDEGKKKVVRKKKKLKNENQ